MNRASRAKIAEDTLQILDAGRYRSPLGKSVEIAEALSYAKTNSQLYTPEQFDELRAQRRQVLKQAEPWETKFEVRNASTLEAARSLVTANPQAEVMALNFASAKNPGGGFRGGSRAQEESLARSSGLYPCIAQMTTMYETNKQFGSCLYTDHMIFSPKVPVIRDDEGELLEEPYLLSFLTAPAVNAGAVKQKETHLIEPTMLRRMEMLLSLAVVQQQQTLVLGAWGCGVFKNEPERVAGWFHKFLAGPEFQQAFRQVTFAVLDNSEEERFIGAFAEYFG